MRHDYTGASPFGRASKIRALLASVDQESTQAARLWALAVASQLVEEHLAALEDYHRRAHHAAQQARCHWAQLVWASCLITICARIDRMRQATTRI